MIEKLNDEQEKCIIQCNLISGTVIEPCEDSDAEKGYCDRTYQNCVEVCLNEDQPGSESPAEKKKSRY